MWKVLFGLVLGIAVMWAGHAYSFLPSPAATFQYTAIPPSRDQLGCKAIASTHLAEKRPFGSKDPAGTVQVDAGRGTDTLAVRIDGSQNRLFLITGADVRYGFRTQGEPMPIIRNDASALVAAHATPGDAEVYIFRLDKQTGNAVWGKVGQLAVVGAVAWTHYMECR